jgi:hypothetical protein
MCIIFLVDKSSVDRYWELEEIGRDRRGKILKKLLSRRRPAASSDGRPSATALITLEKD